MRLRRAKNNRHPRNGVAVVELAMLAPLLAALIFGTLEASRALHVKQVLSDACRSAGRLAVQPTATVLEVQVNAQTILMYNGIDPGTVTVTVNGAKVSTLSLASEGDAIGVSVTVPSTSVGYVLPWFLPADALLTETIVMMRQK